MLVFSGPSSNHMARIPTTGIVSSDADALFPVTNLVGSNALEPYRPFRHATPAAADRSVTIDKNVVANSGGETTDMAGWTENNVGASNDCANVSTPVNGGSRAFSLTIVTTGGSNKAEMYQDRPLRAGEPGTVSVALRGDGTRTVRARVFIPETGQYVTSGGSLTTTPTDFATRSAATYATTTATFTAPAYTAQWPSGEFTLRLIAYMDGAAAGTCYMDDFIYWPHTDTAAVIWHNVMPAITDFQLRRSTDNFGGSDTDETAAFTTVYNPTMYSVLAAMRTERYWRFRAMGTNGAALWYGQLFLGQKLAPSRGPNFGLSMRHVRSQVRQESTAGAVKVYAREDLPRREMTFTWRHVTLAQIKQWRDQVFRASGAGEVPALIIRAESDPESAILGQLPEDFEITYIEAAGGEVDQAQMVLVELAGPSFTG